MNRVNLYLHRMHAFDASLCVSLNRTSRHRWVCLAFRLISRLGDGVFWYTVMLGIVLADPVDGWLPALHMALAGLSGTLVYKWLKGKTLRPRPYEVHQAIHVAGAPLDRFSFPSGHTLHAVVFCSVGLTYFPALAWLLLPFTVLVALSRLVLGLHYPSDVLAGAVIGALIASASFLLI
ncbi:MAG: phosphatase PAP2 family protein [Methylophilaceae bacterium]|jgi:undecaprenyl-diphosphatase|uniref:phosphatase PAP2 family protein n=1 Tax=Methylobacillus sp. MM3 TaxID=1848039 RepID=UPI0007DF43A2|nr:phosphatase PAP2 family protein [Methylobacillus sp. MM3]OAJ69496.1 phosphoesterase PA-phosphatase [Methylobacillus sp. MM3]